MTFNTFIMTKILLRVLMLDNFLSPIFLYNPKRHKSKFHIRVMKLLIVFRIFKTSFQKSKKHPQSLLYSLLNFCNSVFISFFNQISILNFSYIIPKWFKGFIFFPTFFNQLLERLVATF